jgi:hypothetical protein
MEKTGELVADLLVAVISGVLMTEVLWQEEVVIVLLVLLCALLG